MTSLTLGIKSQDSRVKSQCRDDAVMGGEWCSVDATWCGTGAVRSWEDQGYLRSHGAVYMSRCMQESRVKSQKYTFIMINPLVIHAERLVPRTGEKTTTRTRTEETRPHASIRTRACSRRRPRGIVPAAAPSRVGVAEIGCRTLVGSLFSR